MSSELKTATLENIADGVAKELFAHELEQVAKNINDPNCNWEGKRKITLEFTFAPDRDRREIKILVQSKSLLEPIRGHGRTVFLGKHNGKETIFAQDTLQTTFFDEGVHQIGENKNA